jgi:probable rRNA maturation factor
MTRAARLALKIDVLVDSDRWKDAEGVKSMVRRAVTHAAAAVSTTGSELAVVLTDDSAIRSLNRDWRGIDAATNVLSFPAKNAGDERHLGDIVLAFETIAREARGERKPLAHHIAHLAVHGFLHLVGYDHKRNPEATAMENVEREILRQLAIPDPYRPRTSRHGTSRPRTSRRSTKPAARRSTKQTPNRGKKRFTKSSTAKS